MAGIAFKQACPSCETMVPIRDAGLAGKKIECPKCKYRFLVQKPKSKQDDDDLDDVGEVVSVEEDDAPRKKGTKPQPTKPAKGKGKPGSLRDIDEDDMEEITSAKSGSRKKLFVGLGLAAVGLAVLGLASMFILGKPGGGGGKPRPIDPGQIAKNIEPEPIDPKKGDPKPEVKKDPKTPVPKGPDVVLTPPGPELTNLLPNDTEHVFHGFFKDLFDVASPFRSAVFGDSTLIHDVLFKGRLGFSLLSIDDIIRADRFSGVTPWTYTVVHFKEAVDDQAVNAAFGLKRMASIRGHEYFKATKANPLFDQFSRIAVGVPLWLRALNPSAEKPLCVRFHSPQVLIFADEGPMQDLLKSDLQFRLLSSISAPVDPPKEDPVAEKKDPEKKTEFGKETVITTTPNKRDDLTETIWAGKETRPPVGGIVFGPLRFVFDVNGQVVMTTVVGNTAGTYEVKEGNVIVSFGGQFKYVGKYDGITMAGAAHQGNVAWKFQMQKIKGPTTIVVKTPDGTKTAPPPQIRSQSYLTIKPSLKAMLDRLENKPVDSQEQVLYSTATDLDSARIPNNLLPPDQRGTFAWRARQVWDMTTLLEERKPRLRLGGSSLLFKETRTYQYRTEFECSQENDARDLLKLADEQFAPEVARNIDRYIQHKIGIPKNDAALTSPVPMPNVFETRESSKWSAALRDQSVDIKIDFAFDNASLGRTQALASFLALGARAEIDLATYAGSRLLLGKAARIMSEQGVGDRKVPSGTFPPGTFKRPGTSTRGSNTPYHRLSWMTALLPYLGHDGLYQRIDTTVPWRDHGNWLAGRTIVPEFLDASYPEASRFVTVPGLGVAPAATHIVGIAGVGLDAAEYGRDEPGTIAKRGVFGYDRSATIEEILQGRGLAQTIMMMQVPHDGLTGVSPWIAGGGSTLRGVPEKNSLAPFLLSTDKDNKPITHNGKRGTYAIMADGSVRFIDQSIPDDVFKALCTIQAPIPEKADFFRDDRFPLVPDPAKPAEPKITETKIAVPKAIEPKLDPAPKLEVAPPPKKVESK